MRNGTIMPSSAGARRPPLVVESFASFLETAPTFRWLIDGVLPARGLALMYSPPKSFKTFVGLDMSLCVAAGLDWHGHEVEQGDVVYVAGEGVPGLPKRLRAWQQGNRDADPTRHWHIIRRAPQLGPGRDAPDVEELVAAVMERCPDGVALLVIDTLACSALGVNENDAEAMNRYVDALRALIERLGCAVLVLHHTNKAQTSERGSNVMQGACDARIRVHKVSDAIARVENEDQKDEQTFEDLTFKVVRVGDAEQPSCYLQVQPRVHGYTDALIESHAALVLSKLDEMCKSAGGGVTSKALSTTAGMGRHQFNAAMKRLRQTGRIAGTHVRPDGSGAKGNLWTPAHPHRAAA